MTHQDPLAAYARFYETLTPQTVSAVREHVADGIRFRDPFNDTTGVAAYERILSKIFEDMAAPRFETLHMLGDGAVGYLKWRVRFRARNGAERAVVGVSELRFDAARRITEHLDYWDPASQLYEAVPVLGFVLRKIRERMAA